MEQSHGPAGPAGQPSQHCNVGSSLRGDVQLSPARRCWPRYSQLFTESSPRLIRTDRKCSQASFTNGSLAPHGSCCVALPSTLYCHPDDLSSVGYKCHREWWPHCIDDEALFAGGREGPDSPLHKLHTPQASFQGRWACKNLLRAPSMQLNVGGGCHPSGDGDMLMPRLSRHLCYHSHSPHSHKRSSGLIGRAGVCRCLSISSPVFQDVYLFCQCHGCRRLELDSTMTMSYL